MDVRTCLAYCTCDLWVTFMYRFCTCTRTCTLRHACTCLTYSTCDLPGDGDLHVQILYMHTCTCTCTLRHVCTCLTYSTCDLPGDGDLHVQILYMYTCTCTWLDHLVDENAVTCDDIHKRFGSGPMTSVIQTLSVVWLCCWGWLVMKLYKHSMIFPNSSEFSSLAVNMVAKP